MFFARKRVARGNNVMLKNKISKGNNEMSTANMDIQNFLKIYSNEGIIFQPLTAEMEEANVDEIYNIEKVSGVGTKSNNGIWQVQEV
jgi:hypothetical protein